jgi:hypothetical protein
VGDGGDVEAVEDPEVALPGSSEARAKLQVRGSIEQAELTGEGERGALGQEVTDERSMAATFRRFSCA